MVVAAAAVLYVSDFLEELFLAFSVVVVDTDDGIAVADAVGDDVVTLAFVGSTALLADIAAVVVSVGSAGVWEAPDPVGTASIYGEAGKQRW